MQQIDLPEIICSTGGERDHIFAALCAGNSFARGEVAFAQIKNSSVSRRVVLAGFSGGAVSCSIGGVANFETNELC